MNPDNDLMQIAFGMAACVAVPSVIFLMLSMDEWIPVVTRRLKTGACALRGLIGVLTIAAVVFVVALAMRGADRVNARFAPVFGGDPAPSTFFDGGR